MLSFRCGKTAALDPPVSFSLRKRFFRDGICLLKHPPGEGQFSKQQFEWSDKYGKRQTRALG